jgi:hypothetical protein
MENRTKKVMKETESILGYSLPKLTEEERQWKHWMSGGIWTNLHTGEKMNYNELKKTIPAYFKDKYEKYEEFVSVFNRRYNNI